MPQISAYERGTVERRLNELMAEIYTLADRDDLSPHGRVQQLRTLLREIITLKERLNAPVAVEVA